LDCSRVDTVDVSFIDVNVALHLAEVLVFNGFSV
jgi:hypothetical protein